MKSPALGEKKIEKKITANQPAADTCRPVIIFYFHTFLSVENRVSNEEKKTISTDEKREVELESQLSGLPIETNEYGGDLCAVYHF